MTSRSVLPAFVLIVSFLIWWVLGAADHGYLEQSIVPPPTNNGKAAGSALGDVQPLRRDSAFKESIWRIRAVLSNYAAVQPAAGAKLLYLVPGAPERHAYSEADANGTFAVSLDEVPQEFAVWHRHGVRRLVQRAAEEEHHGMIEAAEQDVVLAPAGALLVNCPEVDAPFVVRLSPLAGFADATSPRFLEFPGTRDVVLCEGVPAAWGEVAIEQLVGQNLVSAGRSVVVAGADTVVTLRELSACSVRGQVIDAHGAGLAGAFATVRPADELRDRERSRTTETGGDGRFTLLSVATVPMHLVVSLRGFVSHRALIDCTSGADVNLGTIVLSRGRSLRGQVCHQGVEEMGGIKSVFPSLRVGCSPFAGGGDLMHKSTDLAARASVMVDSEGRFEITGLAPGQYQLFAAAAGHSGGWSGTVVSIADSDLADILLEVPRRRPWLCEIANAQEQPLGRVVTQVFATSILGGWFAKAGVDGSGRAALEVGPGPFLVGVRIGTALRWLQLSNGDLSSERIALPAGILTVQGLDLRTAGDLVYAGVTLVYLEGQLPSEFLPLAMYSGQLKVDAAGDLVLSNLPPGRFRLDIRAPNWGRSSMHFVLQKDEVTNRYWAPEPR